MILLCQEFVQLTSAEGDPMDWQSDLTDLVEHLTNTCREVDPTSTEETITRALAADAIEGEKAIRASGDA